MKSVELKEMRKSKAFKCWRCLVFFYLVLFCVSGLSIGLSASFFLIFRRESHGLSPKIMLYFLLVPTASVIGTTILGWNSVRRKNVVLVKLVSWVFIGQFSVLLAVTVVLEIAGSLWCFGSLQKTQNDVSAIMRDRYNSMSTDEENKAYWDHLQSKFECCGLNGPADYRQQKSFPYSCCGSRSGESSEGSCSLIWQKGCSEVMAKMTGQEMVLMGLIAILIAFMQIPGIFFSWCFANRIPRETI